jgi:uncharacterized protein involved in tolerance to divalent cations
MYNLVIINHKTSKFRLPVIPVPAQAGNTGISLSATTPLSVIARQLVGEAIQKKTRQQWIASQARNDGRVVSTGMESMFLVKNMVSQPCESTFLVKNNVSATDESTFYIKNRVSATDESTFYVKNNVSATDESTFYVKSNVSSTDESTFCVKNTVSQPRPRHCEPAKQSMYLFKYSIIQSFNY